MIYLLHGFGSSATTSATIGALIRTLDVPQSDIVAIDYPYWDPLTTYKTIANAIDPNDHNIVLVGVSLGGFWARHFANQHPGSTLILINPSLDAPSSVVKYLGSTVGGHKISNDYGQLLAPYAIDVDDPSIAISVVVAVDDDIVNPETTISVYSGRAKLYITVGGHRLTVTDTVASFINKAIHTVME